jgi:hypothetical protein
LGWTTLGYGSPEEASAEARARFRATVAIEGAPDGRRRNSIGSRRSSIGRRRQSFGGDRTSIGRDRSSVGSDRTSIGHHGRPFGGDRTSVGRDLSPIGSRRTSIGSRRSLIGRHRRADGTPSPSYLPQTAFGAPQRRFYLSQSKTETRSRPFQLPQTRFETRSRASSPKRRPGLANERFSSPKRPSERPYGSSSSAHEGSVSSKLRFAADQESHVPFPRLSVRVRSRATNLTKQGPSFRAFGFSEGAGVPFRAFFAGRRLGPMAKPAPRGAERDTALKSFNRWLCPVPGRPAARSARPAA